MTTVNEALPRRTSVAGRLVDWVSRGAVQIVLAIIGLFWLVPALGLLVASLRSNTDNSTNGWWHALTAPAQLTSQNYKDLLDNKAIIDSFWNTVFITVPATLLVVVIASLAAYAFAWMDFPGRD